MKKILILLTVATAFQAKVYAQTPSDCTPPALLSSSYGKDASDLALGRIYAVHAPDTSSITISSTFADTVINGLAAIYNLGAALQADSVFRYYCVHAYPHGFIKTSIQVVVDTSYSWTHWWEGSVTTTGNLPLDSFVARYGFTVTSFDWYITGMPMAILQTGQAINTTAFADSLLHFPGVLGWYPNNSAAGINNWIYYTRDTASHFTFVFGWGDCLSGCINARSWTYTVYDDCAVTLDSMHFSPYIPTAPVLPDCNLFPLAVTTPEHPTAVAVFPNPTGNEFRVDVSGYTGIFTCRIIDVLGRVLRSKSMVAGAEMDASSLSSGSYLVALQMPDGQTFHIRFCKL